MGRDPADGTDAAFSLHAADGHGVRAGSGATDPGSERPWSCQADRSGLLRPEERRKMLRLYNVAALLLSRVYALWPGAYDVRLGWLAQMVNRNS